VAAEGLVVIATVALVAGCRVPDPAKEVSVSDLEAYWVVDTPTGETQYLAPAVRLTLANTSDNPHRSLEAKASFRQNGETATWGSDWRRITPRGKPLLPGQHTLAVLKSDARYYSTGPPETMFTHVSFRDANAEVFVRLGASRWHKVGQLAVERRIGAKGVLQGAKE
jgi:hypothetical protein